MVIIIKNVLVYDKLNFTS